MLEFYKRFWEEIGDDVVQSINRGSSHCNSKANRLAKVLPDIISRLNQIGREE